jgi:hypothetical protein
MTSPTWRRLSPALGTVDTKHRVGLVTVEGVEPFVRALFGSTSHTSGVARGDSGRTCSDG